MNKPTALPVNLAYLAGGGEMGALIRAHNWTETPLGPLETWPQSLRSAVSIMLNSRYPIALYWGPELALLYNDAWSLIPGGKHPWALGRPGREVWPEIWDTIGPLYERVFSTGEGVWQEDELLPMHRHGYLEECYFNFTFSPVHGEDGRIDGIFNAVLETTDRVLSERRLRTLSRMGERADPALSMDGACRWAVEIFGENPKDVPFGLIYLCDGDDARLAAAIGMVPNSPAAPLAVPLKGEAHSVWPLIKAQKAEAGLVIAAPQHLDLPSGGWPEPVAQVILVPVIAAGEAKPCAFLVAGANPRRRIDAGYQSFFDLAAGHVATAIATARAYEDERRRAEALAQLDRAKTQFFSNISHEFRTPLTLMLGPLEDALSETDKSALKQHQRLDVAYRNAQRLLRLVNALLDFSRMEAGRVQASFRPTDLAALTADLASSFRSATGRAGLALVVDTTPLTQSAYVDRSMWETIVLNLLSNAFKFTFEGEIRVELRELKNLAQLTVRDTGVGIPAAELPKLFERFHRVEGTQGRSFEGSGIGLALVQELVKQHGGEIIAESELGRGSAFTIILPLGAAHLPAERIDAASGDLPSGTRAQAFVAEALRWLPDAVAADAGAALDIPFGQHSENLTRGRILLADDNADLRDYIERLLRERGYKVEATADGKAALDALRRARPDLLISDVMMPKLDGFALLRAVRADASLKDLPVIMLSARAGEEAKVRGLEAGTDDYLTKPFSARELLARVAANITMARVRREAAAKVAATEERLRGVLAGMGEAFLLLDRDLRILDLNAAALTFEVRPRAEIVGRLHSEAAPNADPQIEQLYREAFDRQTPVALEHYYVWPHGRTAWIDMRAYPVGDHLAVFYRDITERRRADEELRELNDNLEQRVAAAIAEREQTEEALRQAQKMEAVGQLTGGLAHDFNNLLTGISGSLELLQARIAQGRIKDVDRYVNAAQGAARRAAALTHRLLAFSRRQTLEPKPTDINRLVAGMEELIKRTMGPEISIEPVAGVGLWTILVDQSQLENALLNLCINARDAMPGGGKLTIETANRWLDERAAKARDIPPGQYVSLCVSDNGSGMPPEVIARAFDPFYTTKPIGQGTGLGLSMIYGFARQSGGQVRIYSEVGEGTMACLYLPRHLGEAEIEEPSTKLSEASHAKKGETVLIVDDEPTVRMLVTEVLENLGYIAIEAADGAAGLKILQSNVQIDLLVTDVGLPGGMNGRQLADAARVSRRDLKVLFITGYAENAVLSHGHLEYGMQVMTKPFAMDALAMRIRDLIESAGHK